MTQQQQTRRQNLEQQRGKQAWENIREVKALDQSNGEKKLEKEYRSLARSLNATIQINGLGQTLGFFKAKGGGNAKKAHSLLLKHLTAWMCSPEHFSASNPDAMKGKDDGLLHWVVDSETSSADYRRATAECLAFGAWLRRFAEAELEEMSHE